MGIRSAKEKLTPEKFSKFYAAHMSGREIAELIGESRHDVYEVIKDLITPNGGSYHDYTHRLGISDRTWKLIASEWTHSPHHVNRDCYYRCKYE